MVCLPTERQTGCNKQFNYRNMNLDVMHSGDWSLIGPSLKSTNSYRHNGRKATDCCWNFHRRQRQDVITGGRYATTEEKTRNFQNSMTQKHNSTVNAHPVHIVHVLATLNTVTGSQWQHSLWQWGSFTTGIMGYTSVFGHTQLGYPAANYQPAPDRTHLGGSWVTHRRPKSAGLVSSGV